jgi:Ca2+-binding EF-hand superfamily protein
MGCSTSKVEREYEELVIKTLNPLSDLFDILGIGIKEQRKLFRVFDKMDKDGGRKIDFEEFCEFFRIPITNFARRCFLLMDSSGVGEMSFPQFCICAWNYCTYDSVGLSTFAFNLYDKEGLGVISNSAMYDLIEESYDIQNKTKQGDWGADLIKNTPEYNMKLAKLKIAKASGLDEQMDLKEWIKYCRTAPNLLKRAYVMQTRLQQDICGEGFWETMTRKRRRKTKFRDEIIDWKSIDEILYNFERDQGLKKILHVVGKPKKVQSTQKQKGANDTAINKKSSKYASPQKEAPRTLKRVRSQEEQEFTKRLPTARNRVKVLKRKKSAESIQKMMRMKLAKKQVKRLREAKIKSRAKLRAVGHMSSSKSVGGHKNTKKQKMNRIRST